MSAEADEEKESAFRSVESPDIECILTQHAIGTTHSGLRSDAGRDRSVLASQDYEAETNWYSDAGDR